MARSLVAFGPKQRAIGEPAKTQETSNLKNTVGCLKRLAGRTLQDPDIRESEKRFINAKLVDAGNTVGVEVSSRSFVSGACLKSVTIQVDYLGAKHTFSATQLVAMFLGKLRDITAQELKTGISDVVIAIPGWFTDIQRRAVLDAAQIAGLNTLRLVNDSTAVALGYGITKSDLPEPENARHVVFVDVGHSSMSVCVAAFSKGQLIVKSAAHDRHLGGREFDYALVKHFSEEFKTKYRIDVMSNAKATFRLTVACERLKKVLSANHDAPLNVESIMNDIDASSKLNRDQFEKLVADVLDRIPIPIQCAVAESGLDLDEIDAIELVGGSTRIPAVRGRIQQVFPGKPLSTTLNQDEAVARGATFACAMLSPVFRVRDFHMHDITPYPIKVQWATSPSDPDEDSELVVFPRGNTIPSTKVLSFYRKEPFEIEALYADPSSLPRSVNPWLAKFTAKSVPEDPKGDVTCVKLKTRLNLHGVLSFEGAYVEEIEEREEPQPQPMDVEGTPDSTVPAPTPPKKKKIVKKKEIPWVATTSSLDNSLLEKFKEQEADMHSADKLVMDTEV
jgi:heat shock protein 4